MATGKINIGKLVWITDVPLALYMKPKNAPDLWTIGIVVDKTESGYCFVYSAGNIDRCHQNHLRALNKTE